MRWDIRNMSYELGQLSRHSDGWDERPGFDSGQGQEIFLYPTARPDRLGGPLSLLPDEYMGLFRWK
jgi:hypothetical protein